MPSGVTLPKPPLLLIYFTNKETEAQRHKVTCPRPPIHLHGSQRSRCVRLQARTPSRSITQPPGLPPSARTLGFSARVPGLG